MKTYRINVRQDFEGVVDGTIDIAAKSGKAATNKLKKMSEKKVEKLAHWTSSDLYTTEISFDPTTIIEL